MEWIEATGKDVDEAKESALDILGVEESEIEFEVLEEGRPSFLGFGRRNARIRARLRPSFPAPKRDRRQRRRRSGGKSSDSEAGSSQGTKRTHEPKAESTRPRVEAPKAREREGEEIRMADEVSEGGSSLSRVDLANKAQEFLAGLLHEFGIPGEVKVTSLDDEQMELEVTGEQLGPLVGPRGTVLAAIQELTRSVVQVAAGEGAGRVLVDIAGYRQRRKEALTRFAREQAELVLASGEERVFEPMSAPDRKIIHDVVAEIAGVATRSEGEEPHRYVVLYPDSEAQATDAPEAASVDS
jgi:spoIIIJ-associated protein